MSGWDRPPGRPRWWLLILILVAGYVLALYLMRGR